MMVRASHSHENGNPFILCHSSDFYCHSRESGNPDFLLYHLMKMEIQNTKNRAIFLPTAEYVK